MLLKAGGRQAENQWQITVGYDSPHVIVRKSGPSSIFVNETREQERKYKLVRIDGITGDFISMKIRDI